MVDDDADDICFFAEVLREVSSYINVLSAENGVEALAELGRDTILPDLIFLDLNMPQMGGKGFTNILVIVTCFDEGVHSNIVRISIGIKPRIVPFLYRNPFTSPTKRAWKG